MNENKKNGCQVLLCTCPAIMPYSFACHCWFVIDDGDQTERWELLHVKNEAKPEWGHIHNNFYSVFTGIQIVPFSQSMHWPITVLHTVNEQPAEKLSATLRSTPHTYPHADNYELLGPNSNTYTQWVINQHPELDLSLPWNAVGKGFV